MRNSKSFMKENDWITGSSLTLLVLSLLCYLYWVWGYTFLNDDAFISFRYADQWAKHGEVVYNLGEKVEGYTNFLWMALMAGVIRLGGDAPQWSLILGCGFGLMTLLLLYRSKQIYEFEAQTDQEKSFIATSAITAIFLLACSPAYTCWSSGGLEVTCFTFLLTAAILLTLYGYRKNYTTSALYISAGVLFAFASMTRPEGLLFIGVLGLIRSIRCVLNQRMPTAYDYCLILGFLVIYLPYFYWRYQYYGYLFPNTYYVKTGAANLWGLGLIYLGDFVVKQPWVLLVLIAFPQALKKCYSDQSEDQAPQALKMIDVHLYVMSVCFLFLVHVCRIGGDFMALHRFLVPILPLLALYAAPIIIHLINQAKLPSWALILVVIILPSLSTSYYHQHQAMKIGSHLGVDSIGWLKQFSKQCSEIGRWINTNTPKESKLATTAAGAIAFYADRYTVDLLGLNDTWIAHHVKATHNRPGHGKSAPFSYPLKKRVNYLIYHPSISHQKPSAHPRLKRALVRWKYQWETHQIPQMNPPWWGVWVLQQTQTSRGTP